MELEDIENNLESFGSIQNLQFYENLLVKGDNADILRFLLKQFPNVKVKSVYIDPPYNTKNTFDHYSDSKERDEWLLFMEERLVLVKKLLREDGVVFVQIDDNEFAHLYILMAKIFGESNLKTIVVKMSELSGLKMGTSKHHGGIPKLKEYIIIAMPNGIKGLHFEKIPKEKWDPEYNIFLDDFTWKDKQIIDNIKIKLKITELDIEQLDEICKKIKIKNLNKIIKERKILSSDQEQFKFDNAWRICRSASSTSVLKLAKHKMYKDGVNQIIFTVLSKRDGILYFVKSDFTPDAKKPRVQLLFAEDHLKVHPGDLWTDIKTTGLEFEGGISFKNGKKPEKLLERIIKGSTREGDLILDPFLGSGTTASVAIDLNRKWIGIEIEDHTETHALIRLKNKVGNSNIEKIGFKYLKI